jgi:hypothetical protein
LTRDAALRWKHFRAPPAVIRLGLNFNMVLDGKFVVSDEIQIAIEGELVEKQPESAAADGRRRAGLPPSQGMRQRRRAVRPKLISNPR